MSRLYTNENFPQPAVEKLRALGHDVETTQDAGKSGQAVPDQAVLDHATASNRILITLNRRHFVQLHMRNQRHAGIIVCSFDRDFAALADRIHQALHASVSLHGQLVRINRPC